MLLQQLLEMKEDNAKKFVYRISFSREVRSMNSPMHLEIPDDATDEMVFVGASAAEYEKEMLDLLNNHRSSQFKTPFKAYSFRAKITLHIDSFIRDARDSYLDNQEFDDDDDRDLTYGDIADCEDCYGEMPFEIDFTVSLSRKFSKKELEDLAEDAGVLIFGSDFEPAPYDELDVEEI